jgi:hypothetical protein
VAFQTLARMQSHNRRSLREHDAARTHGAREGGSVLGREGGGLHAREGEGRDLCLRRRIVDGDPCDESTHRPLRCEQTRATVRTASAHCPPYRGGGAATQPPAWEGGGVAGGGAAYKQQRTVGHTVSRLLSAGK